MEQVMTSPPVSPEAGRARWQTAWPSAQPKAQAVDDEWDWVPEKGEKARPSVRSRESVMVTQSIRIVGLALALFLLNADLAFDMTPEVPLKCVR